MSKTVSISEYLFLRLKEMNVNHLFGIPGDYVLPLFDELIDKKTGVTHIGSKNELNAAYSADGYSKINGFGAAAVTYGVGALSATNGVAGSYSDNTPTLLISGAPSRSARATNGNKLLHHLIGTDFDTCLNVFSAVTVAAVRLESESEAPHQIDDLLIKSFRHKKPVYLEIPYDLQQAEVPAPSSPLNLSAPLSNSDRLKEVVSTVKKLVTDSETISALAGPLLDRNRLVPDADQLIRTLKIAVGTLFTSKISEFEEHPQAAGFYQGMSCEDACRESIENADLMIGLGATYNEFDTGMFTSKIGENQKTIFLMNDHAVIDGTYYMDVYLCDVLPVLVSELKDMNVDRAAVDQNVRRFAFELSDNFDPTNDPLKIDRMFTQFAAAIHTGDTVFGDTGGYINAAQAQFHSGVQIYGCGNWGSLGAGFGMSVGGSIACSENPKGKVYCITGDGAFLMSAQELSVLIEHGIDYTIIVLDNSGYGAERQIWPGKERSYNEFRSWNHELLPVAFGGTEGKDAHGIVVKTEKEFDAALKKSRDLKGVKLIRAMLDRWDTASFNVKMSEAMRH